MKIIVVHVEHDVTNVALLEDNKLVEYYVEPSREEQAGSVYKGRVVNVLPGMQAAFVDIGQARNAFIYVDDLLAPNLDKQPAQKPCITELVRDGEEILVQVAREATGTKGAKVTTHYSIPGRYIVYMPGADYIGVSRKIDLTDERQRLKEIAERLRAGQEGLIIRTVTSGASEEEINKDLAELRAIWQEIDRAGQAARAPSRVYRDLEMVPRLLRDLFDENVDELVINDDKVKTEIELWLQQYAPHLAPKIRDYRQPVSMPHYYGIYDALDKALRPKVWLDSGAYLIIDQTEALTVIDVNTGKYTGAIDLEQTAYETNMQAAGEIARLLRLRDIGGIIIIDFIDMGKEEHRLAVAERMNELTRADRTKTIVVGWTQLGLLEMTRKKVRSNGDKRVYEICSHCGGTGKRYL